MLSYRHGFHAGNFADVHKHVVLTLLIQALMHKDSAFCYIDTHAGAGIYDLRSEFANKLREYESGIGRLWQRSDVPVALQPYLASVRAANGGDQQEAGVPRHYPGSPAVVLHMLRPQDRMVLMELHTTEAPLLARHFAQDHQVAVHHQDGYQGLKAFLPPKERRGLVLIDPAYELQDEFERVVAGVREIHKRWATGMIAVWYPLQARAAIPRFHCLLQETGIRKMLMCEFYVLPGHMPRGLYGSGVIVINPPWQLDDQLREAMRWLDPVLAQGTHPAPRIEWLVPE